MTAAETRAYKVPDLYEPFGKLKVDYDVDDLGIKLHELKSRFKEINFDAVLKSSEELLWAGVTDTTTKRQSPGPRTRLRPIYTNIEGDKYGHEHTSHRAAAMLSMHSTVVQETPARSQRRVSDLTLPAMPETPDETLPVPEGVNEWLCLQDAVTSVSHEKFTTHYAKLGWRKWAMMHANANVMVDLFWWISATFFCKEDPNAARLRSFLYHRFSRHFINLLIVDAEMGDSSLQSKLRDTYQRNFIHMLAVAACNLFRAAAPRSAPLFDTSFLRAVTKQLRIWTSGLLPADSHSMKAAGSGADAKNSTSSASTRPWTNKGKQAKSSGSGSGSGRGVGAEPSGGLRVEVPEEEGADPSALPQLRGKAARGAFDIAKTSPFVTHFLEHHNLKPNDLNRGLLNRHVCGSRLQQPFLEDEEEENCASFAAPAVLASRSAQAKYEKRARGAVGHKLRVRKELQSGLRDLSSQRGAALRGDAAREMANKLANWVDYSKERAAAEEAERRETTEEGGEGGDGSDESGVALIGARNKALKDARDMMAHHHCLSTEPPERKGGYQRHTAATNSVRIARQAREALGSMYRDYGSMPGTKSAFQ